MTAIVHMMLPPFVPDVTIHVDSLEIYDVTSLCVSSYQAHSQGGGSPLPRSMLEFRPSYGMPVPREGAQGAEAPPRRTRWSALARMNIFNKRLRIPLNNLRASAQLTGQGTRYSMNKGVDKLLVYAPSSRTFSIEHLCGLYCV